MILDGLILHAKLDESTGATTVVNSANSSLNGTVSGSPTFSQQRINNGCVFAGGQLISYPAGLVIPVSTFTISLWYKATTWTSGARLLDYQDAGPSGGVTILENGSTGNVQAVIRNGAAATATLNTGVLTSSTLYHLCVVLSGGVATLYVNGVQVDQASSVVMTTPAAVVTLGRRSPTASNFLTGALDDVRIYNLALATSDIQLLAAGGGFSETKAAVRKRYLYKVYSSTGQYITAWTDVANDPTYHVVINGGYVEMDIRLARKTIDFGEGVDVAFGNEVQVWCFDQDAVDGVKIFAGYISRYDPRNDGPEDSIVVYCLGYHTLMSQFMHEDSLGSTGISYNSTDPGEIAEDVIIKARNQGIPINWDETTLQKTGTVASYTFKSNTVQECIDKCLELAPAGWYWYVDANKKLNMHPKPDQAKHTFTLGKEIFYMEPQKRIENVINRIYFIGGIPSGQTTAIYGRYERPMSIQSYGLRAVKKTDERVTLQSTMDTICDNILDAQQEIEIRTVIRVKDNDYDRDTGYNIESILIGDTCQIRNYQDAFSNSKWDVMSWDIDYWDYNVRNLTELVMQIVEIQYTPNYVELTISSKIPNVSKRIEDINRNLVDSIAVDAPSNPFIGTV